MNFQAFQILAYLYWLLLLLVTGGSLALAVLAFRQQRQQYAIASAGGLAAALVIAAVPAPEGAGSFGIVLAMVALALSVVGGGPMAVLALRLATNNTVPPGAHGGILVGDGAAAATAGRPDAVGTVHEVLRGGLMIGILERLAVAGAILAGFPEAIAVVVAIKGVGRFTELAAAEARERFIIGTFASLIWACACAALVRLATA
ncbi:putative lipid-binding transport protein (Tim44 family) [Cryobacterium sp. MP_M5]|uniref:hypothetical protein n=1 Tax=unclassified Cryobacterium TaxID=2649013 RepID=UPI0018C9ED99|nr:MULTISPECIES: hypothetical protein [unclassified Cryobacterium]MBG6057495.1 putative lipid-binding transport protein (Tim44 family) [Cryobacterium sp. MP_M3]MEC5175694.1 putative lipid-binding transport protein (Tim44 family) [Cryobacterium sp. MP_M5]